MCFDKTLQLQISLNKENGGNAFQTMYASENQRCMFWHEIMQYKWIGGLIINCCKS
jgi:hypothetical protein